MSNKNITPETVAAKAAEDKLVTTVPAQAEGEDKTTDTAATPELTVVEGGKKTLKERLAVVTEKVKENKKALIVVGAAAGVAALAFVKYAKKKAEEALVEAADGETVTDGQIETLDDSAV